MTDNVTPIGVRCDFHDQDDADRIIRCPSRNAEWVPDYQGNLCIVHKAAREQAKRKHPSNQQRTMDPTQVIETLAREIYGANLREALGGYFDHLWEDTELIAAIKLYSGVDMGEPQGDDDSFNTDGEPPF